MIGELNNIHMQLETNLRVQHFIDISVIDILDVYGMLLSRDWSRRLNGYFATGFSHMWLPWRGVPNQINIDSTPRLRLMITKYSEDNEILFLEKNLGTYKSKVEEVLMLQSPNGEINSQRVTNSTEAVVESDNDSSQEMRGRLKTYEDLLIRTSRQALSLAIWLAFKICYYLTGVESTMLFIQSSRALCVKLLWRKFIRIQSPNVRGD